MPDLAVIKKRYEAATKLLEAITGEASAFSEFDTGTDDAFRRIVELAEETHALLTDLPAVVEALEEARVLLKEIVNAKPARLKAAMFAAEKYLGEQRMSEHKPMTKFTDECICGNVWPCPTNLESQLAEAQRKLDAVKAWRQVLAEQLRDGGGAILDWHTLDRILKEGE